MGAVGGRWKRRGAGLAVAACALGAAMGGCSRSSISARLKTDYNPRDLQSEMTYWHSLSGRGALSNDEAFKGLVLTAMDEDPSNGYAARVALMKQKGWLDAKFDEPAEWAVQCGTVARALVQILGIRGGVMMRVMGPTQRYALRELVYEGIMTDATEAQTINGDEFMATMSKAQDYIDYRKVEAERAAAGAKDTGKK